MGTLATNTTTVTNAGPARPARDLAIDRLRGALVIIMVSGDYLAGVSWIPTWLKHAPDIGFTIADIVAPLFVFVIGLNFGLSFARRYEESSSAAYRHFVTRYLSLIGVGAIITGGATLVDQSTGWGVLESLGVAGLITIPFIRLATWARFAIGVTMLIGYQLILDASMLEVVLNSGHGGFFGSISWAALLLLSTAVSDVWRRGLRSQILCSGALAIAATISMVVVPVSKNRVSMSFVLLSLAISALTFLVFKTVSDATAQKVGPISWWGRHSLALYLTHLLVLSIFGLPEIPWWYGEAPLWLVALQLTAILGFMTWVASRLRR